jgi:phosphatidylethanolamine/phosphatidyl-N-methylethanolamine N-methyltransferase
MRGLALIQYFSQFNQDGHTKMDLTTFAMEAMADFRTVGAVAPSSRYLTQAMLRPLPLERARVVVEVGSGTGAMTQALLNLIPLDATLLAFEINSRFSHYLKSNVSDSRLDVINASAETLRKEVHRRGYERVDAVASSLALGFMPDWQRRAFLSELGSLLGEAGVFTQYQYFHALQLKNGQVRRFDLKQLLHQYFRSVQRRVIWRNLPPAFVFVCREPLCAETPHSLRSKVQPSGHADSKGIRHDPAGPKSSKIVS